MSPVSVNIKAIRLKKKLSLEEMSDRLFIEGQTVSDWENGEVKPDIDMLSKIADILDTDITTLIYGLPAPETRKKDIRQIIIAVCVLLVLGISLYFLSMTANKMKMHFVPELAVLIQIFLLPLFWLVLGWTIMQGLGVLGVAKQNRTKFSKPIHIASLGIVLLYAALMLPFTIETINCLIQSLKYQQNPDLFPSGFQYSYNIPLFLQSIELKVMSLCYKEPAVFIIPSIVFWLTKPKKYSQELD